MKDLETLNAIRTHSENIRKVVVSRNNVPIPAGAEDWTYGIAQNQDFIPEKVRAMNTFKMWEILNRETLVELPEHVNDAIELDDRETDRLEFPVYFYLH